MTKIVIKNVCVFDSENVLLPNDVVITRSAGNITNFMGNGSHDVEDPDLVIDGHGCTLVPGLIDANVNIKGANSAVGAFASHGVTTVIDLSSNTQQCQALRVYAAGRTKLPTFLSAGTEAKLMRGNGQARLFDDNPDEVIIRTPQDVEVFVASRASGPDRADFVKVAVDPSFVDDLLLKITVDAAHDHGMLAIARTAGLASYKRSMQAGFDVFIHAPLDAPIEPDLAREMAAKNKTVVPTLGILRSRADPPAAASSSSALGGVRGGSMRPGAAADNIDLATGESHTYPAFGPGGNFDYAVRSVRTLNEAGVTICAGSTANLVPGSEVPFGESLHEELELLVAAGMSRLEVMRSATCVAATAFRLSDRGIVRNGLRADLLLLEGNPLEDITATRKIRKMWIRGEDIERA